MIQLTESVAGHDSILSPINETLRENEKGGVRGKVEGREQVGERRGLGERNGKKEKGVHGEMEGG